MSESKQRRKRLEIEKCSMCPYFRVQAFGAFCVHANIVVRELGERAYIVRIPDWCPLPDAEHPICAPHCFECDGKGYVESEKEVIRYAEGRPVHECERDVFSERVPCPACGGASADRPDAEERTAKDG